MTNTKYNKLIIQVSLQNFTFCIKNQISNEILHFKSLPITSLVTIENQLESIFSQHELLQVTYDDVLILHDNNLNTFVPEAYFDERTLGGYLQYNTKVFATDFFSFDDLDNYQMKNIYVPYVAFNNFFLDKFGEFTYKNINTNLVEYVLSKTLNLNDVAVYANISDTHFELVVSKKGTLILFNSFEIQTPEDFIYYILFVYEQLNLNTEITPIYFLGLIDETDLNYKIAYKYIRNIFIANIEVSLNTELQNLKNNFILIHS